MNIEIIYSAVMFLEKKKFLFRGNSIESHKQHSLHWNGHLIQFYECHKP